MVVDGDAAVMISIPIIQQGCLECGEGPVAANLAPQPIPKMAGSPKFVMRGWHEIIPASQSCPNSAPTRNCAQEMWLLSYGG